MSPAAVSITGERAVELVDEPAPAPPGPGQVQVDTRYSGISSGTELAAYRGTTPFLHREWNPELLLFQPRAEDGSAKVDYPIVGTGYEEVGTVSAVGEGVTGLAPGDLVYGAWGHRAVAVVDGAYVRDRMLPPGTPEILGIFSQIGAIALNSTLDTRVHVGETAVVFGLGVVGQLVAQLLRLSGARVVGVDLLERRRELALELGAHVVLDPLDGDVAQHVRELTGGRGADVCVEASGATPALHEATRACAYSSRVVAVGFYQGGATTLRLGEEFHHNRIELVCSQIGGLAPELQHRWDRLRLVQTFMDLACSGAVQVEPLVTHVVPVAEAASAYALLDERPGEVVQAVLEFPRGASA